MQDVRGAETAFTHGSHCANESEFGDHPFHGLAKHLTKLRPKLDQDQH